jgi:hypothetical protein
VSEFYAGQLPRNGPLMEWDGSNETDIVTWVNLQAADTWTVDSASPTTLVLRTGSVTRSIPINGWVQRSQFGPQSLDKTPFAWTTPDPLGRPTSLDDLIYEE